MDDRASLAPEYGPRQWQDHCTLTLAQTGQLRLSYIEPALLQGATGPVGCPPTPSASRGRIILRAEARDIGPEARPQNALS
jgi:hypothetical protein